MPTPPPPRESAPSGLADQVARDLRERILRGELGSGQPLREPALAAEYAASRNTVREAFRLLARERLVVHQAHKGVTVRTLDASDVHDIYDVRLALEPRGLRLAGAQIDETNPVASAFTAALGDVGRIFFGTVMWIAAITSVIGCSYTSTSFVKVLGQWVTDWERWVVVGFIVVSTLAFVALGSQPVTLLVFAGAFNALILPFGLGVLLWVAWRRRDLLDGYAYPRWLWSIGALAWLAAIGVGVPAVKGLAEMMGGA